jgi:hypothetical protein
MSRRPTLRLVSRFSDALLVADLPALPNERRREVTAFIRRRLQDLPSPMRLGVGAVALGTGAAGAVVGTDRVVGLLRRWPVPLAADYVRLVRSLAYAYVWDRWPATGPRGET